jgi:hypothetical protein
MISPLHLSEEEIAEVLENADVIETWLTAVRGLAYAAIADGRDIPGWKLALSALCANGRMPES